MGAAFSNGTEFDAWAAHWCDDCRHESTCAILTEALLGDTPKEWIEGDWLALGRDRYTCTEFSEAGR